LRGTSESLWADTGNMHPPKPEPSPAYDRLRMAANERGSSVPWREVVAEADEGLLASRNLDSVYPGLAIRPDVDHELAAFRLRTRPAVFVGSTTYPSAARRVCTIIRSLGRYRGGTWEALVEAQDRGLSSASTATSSKGLRLLAHQRFTGETVLLSRLSGPAAAAEWRDIRQREKG